MPPTPLFDFMNHALRASPLGMIGALELDDSGECPFAAHDLRERPGSVNAEHNDRQMVFPRQADRGGIHDLEVVRQDVEVGQLLVAGGALHLARIGGVDAVDLGALQQRVALHLRRAQGRRGVGGEERDCRCRRRR